MGLATNSLPSRSVSSINSAFSFQTKPITLICITKSGAKARTRDMVGMDRSTMLNLSGSRNWRNVEVKDHRLATDRELLLVGVFTHNREEQYVSPNQGFAAVMPCVL